MCGDKININNLIINYQNLEKKLGCTFEIVDEIRFGQGKYDCEFDILCITCGNTAGARELWKNTGCEEVIRRWYQNGVVYTGYSAGFILFYDWASTDSVPGPPTTQFGIMSGMGIIKGAAIPHADTQPRRIPDFQLSLKINFISPALALGEDVMAVYIDEEMKHLVSPISKPMCGFVTAETVEHLQVEKI